jgi:hypothetical protein
MNREDDLEETITSITAKANEHAMRFFERIMAKGDEKRNNHNDSKTSKE